MSNHRRHGQEANNDNRSSSFAEDAYRSSHQVPDSFWLEVSGSQAVRGHREIGGIVIEPNPTEQAIPRNSGCRRAWLMKILFVTATICLVAAIVFLAGRNVFFKSAAKNDPSARNNNKATTFKRPNTKSRNPPIPPLVDESHNCPSTDYSSTSQIDAPMQTRTIPSYNANELSCVVPDSTISSLQSSMFFYPLECNKDISSTTCTPWTSMFTNSETHASKIVIPCEKCVTMDYSGISSLKLSKGLDIQGKLVIPDNYSVTIETPYVQIQGELVMTSTKKVNGQEAIRIILRGSIANQFIPAGSNLAACGQVGCDVGKKPIVVAGGKLDIEGLPDNTPTWVHLHDVSGYNPDGTVTSLIVRDDILGTWGEGAEVLITSHTINYDDEQVRTISTISQHADDGYVVVGLDSPILRPSTVVDNPDFAVEVALLSRNIVFEGAKDDTANPLHGGHLIVLQTPTVNQKLIGVEFTNFGQQGNLGRYPIHFHLSHDVCGSVVSKNLIRESNQRCIVVHGTHNLLVDSNVAYDTAGHCFLTEDGNEQGNTFRYNLGAMTRKVEILIGVDEETDDEPATFWATNPSNTWVGNVAAGSERNGYWFEFRGRVRGPSLSFAIHMKPNTERLILFKDNVAHSNGDHGIRTYPKGYFPKDNRAIFYNTKSYRNKNSGIFAHNSRKLTFSGGIYADNRIQIDLDRTAENYVHNVTVIGYSDEYRDVVSRQQQVVNSSPQRCRSERGYIYGFDMHSFTRRNHYAPTLDYGVAFEYVDVRGFVGTGCNKSFAFNFDDVVESKHFDFFSSLSSINIEGNTVPINFCEAQAAGVTNIFVTDLDSSLRPPGMSNFTGTSTILSNTGAMTTFINTEFCINVPDECYSYCKDCCLRQITFRVNAAETAGYMLQICRTSKQPQECIWVDGKYHYEVPSDEYEYEYENMENSQASKNRIFGVALPKGTYHAVFFDEDKKKVWPTFAEEVYEKPMCNGGIDDDTVTLEIPPLQDGECRNLIKNGNAEYSNTSFPFWLHSSGGIQLRRSEGIGGSNALGDIERVNSRADGIVQYLDSRCISSYVGSRYEIMVWVKLVKKGEIFYCDFVTEDCPEVRLDYTSNVCNEPEDKSVVVATMVKQAESRDGYMLLHGEVYISDEMASSSSVMFQIRRKRDDVEMFVDNVSMKLSILDKDCENIVPNGDFHFGDSRYWSVAESTSIELRDMDRYQLKTSRGAIPYHALIRTGCLEVDERYIVTTKFQLLSNGIPYDCNENAAACPTMKLRSKIRNSYFSDVFETMGISSGDGWNTLSGVFTATEFSAKAEEIRLSYEGVASGRGMVIGHASITKLPMDCSELIMNGSMELGYPSFWKKFGSSGYFSYSKGYKSSTAVRYSGRTKHNHGLQYETDSLIDYRCLKGGTSWKVTAQVKLFEGGTESGASCHLDIIDNNHYACPSVRIVLFNEGKFDPVLDTSVHISKSTSWRTNGWNRLEGTITIPGTGISRIDAMYIVVMDFNSGKDIAVDDFSITPV